MADDPEVLPEAQAEVETTTTFSLGGAEALHVMEPDSLPEANSTHSDSKVQPTQTSSLAFPADDTRVAAYAAGKPRRVVIRARIIHPADEPAEEAPAAPAPEAEAHREGPE
jgi:hypothetical protein